jgi:hypothetical protein
MHEEIIGAVIEGTAELGTTRQQYQDNCEDCTYLCLSCEMKQKPDACDCYEELEVAYTPPSMVRHIANITTRKLYKLSHWVILGGIFLFGVTFSLDLHTETGPIEVPFPKDTTIGWLLIGSGVLTVLPRRVTDIVFAPVRLVVMGLGRALIPEKWKERLRENQKRNQSIDRL